VAALAIAARCAWTSELREPTGLRRRKSSALQRLLAFKTEIETSRCQMRIAESFGPVPEGIDLATQATRATGAALVLLAPTSLGGPILL
jgi:hypothetical protein